MSDFDINEVISTTFGTIKLAQKQAFEAGYKIALARVATEVLELLKSAKEKAEANKDSKYYTDEEMDVPGLVVAGQVIGRISEEAVPDYVDPRYVPQEETAGGDPVEPDLTCEMCSGSGLDDSATQPCSECSGSGHQ